jgi:hypothetical protein
MGEADHVGFVLAGVQIVFISVHDIPPARKQ